MCVPTAGASSASGPGRKKQRRGQPRKRLGRRDRIWATLPEEEKALWRKKLKPSRDLISSARDALKLVEKWYDISRPRKRGAKPKAPEHVEVDFPRLFHEWLEARDLRNTLEREADQTGYAVYRLIKNQLTCEQEKWDLAFHGTRWYALRSILTCGCLLASDNKEAGHDFWEPGVYCTPVLKTAQWYARPHIVFGDGVYHRVLLEVRVHRQRLKRRRHRGGVQWVFDENAVIIRAVWLQINSPPDTEESRFDSWDPDLEVIPPGQNGVGVIINQQQLSWSEEDAWKDAWDETPEEEMKAGGKTDAEAVGHKRWRENECEEDEDDEEEDDNWGTWTTKRATPRLVRKQLQAVTKRSHPPRGTLQLLTFGLENADNDLEHKCKVWKDGGGGATAKFTYHELHKALHRLGHPRVDFILDARCFIDPKADDIINHIGVHPEIIQRIIGHRHFYNYFRDAKQEWNRAVAYHNDKQPGSPLHLVVAIYCRAGKHRSVAVAECLRHVATAVEGFSVDEVCHLSKPRWNRRLCKGDCEECRTSTSEKEQAMMHAEQIWQNC